MEVLLGKETIRGAALLSEVKLDRRQDILADEVCQEIWRLAV